MRWILQIDDVAFSKRTEASASVFKARSRGFPKGYQTWRFTPGRGLTEIKSPFSTGLEMTAFVSTPKRARELTAG